MGQAFLASYLIGLREGLEASLVVSILVAYLVKAGRRSELTPLWAGVGAALVLSVVFGALLTYTQTTLLADSRSQALFEAGASVVAVVLVTWMIFWMRRTARRLKAELTGRLERAVGAGAFAVAGIAFVSVIREGLETSVLFYAAAQGAATSATPLVALTAGVLSAALIGVLLYAGAIRINLGKFFTVSGVLLILVAAGVLKYGVAEFQEAGVLPGREALAFDISGAVDPGSWYGSLLSGMFGLTPTATVLECIVWVAYLVPVLLLFLWPSRRTRAAAPSPNVVAEVPPEPAAPGSSPATTPTNPENPEHVRA